MTTSRLIPALPAGPAGPAAAQAPRTRAASILPCFTAIIIRRGAG